MQEYQARGEDCWATDEMDQATDDMDSAEDEIDQARKYVSKARNQKLVEEPRDERENGYEIKERSENGMTE